MATKDSTKVISIFSGAGGFSLGFSWAGLKPTIGIDNNRDACQTYQTNSKIKCHHKDLSELDSYELLNLVGKSEPFLMIGGPPCQGFSSAGLRSLSDKRNKLIFNYLKFVETIRPKWFVFENVEGLLTSGNGEAIFLLVKEFLKLGYFLKIHKINFASYGVPQTRKRVLIIGNNLNINFDFPKPLFSYDSGKSKSNADLPFAPTLLDAISGLGKANFVDKVSKNYPSNKFLNTYDELMRSGNEKKVISDHFYQISDADVCRASFLKEGYSMKDIPSRLWPPSFKKRAFRRVKDGTPTECRGGAPSGMKRLYGNKQALTITSAATREFFHPNENRPLTIRECARLQSFPDNFQFIGNSSSKIKQIGNAVPPIGAKFIAEMILKVDGLHGSGFLNKKDQQSFHQGTLLDFKLTDSNGMSPALKRTNELLRSLI